MKIDSANQTNFQAKVSPQFESFMRKYINQGENRMKNNYRLDKKIADLASYGYDEYTINLADRYVGWGKEYSLVATQEGQSIKKGILITTKTSFKQIQNYFFNLRCSELKRQMKRHHIYNK